MARKTKAALLKSTERDFVIVHLAFGALCALALFIPMNLSLGWRIFGLVVIYNVALPALGRRLDHRRWVDIWTFVFPLSLLQIFPDWFLSQVVGVLVFPDTGFFFIGTVPLFMGGMWTIPFTLILFTAWRLRKRLTPASVYLTVVLLALAVFGTAEATLWMLPIWYATEEVLQVAHIAIYVMLAEFVLAAALWTAYRMVERERWPRKLVAAFTVMLIYTGALAFFYLLIEG